MRIRATQFTYLPGLPGDFEKQINKVIEEQNIPIDSIISATEVAQKPYTPGEKREWVVVWKSNE